eukprot:tig00000157_g9607.t1
MPRYEFGNTGLASMLKEGARHFSGLDEATFRNIDACKQLSQMTRTSLGPHGMNKIIINHLDKLFVTNDSATMVKEMEIQHPAAKMLVYGSQQQEQEVGDGTNTVIVIGGELLVQAESLLRMGLHTSEVISGYAKAGKKALEILESLVEKTIDDVRNKDLMIPALKTVVGSKQYGAEDILTPLIAEACIQVCPKNPKKFNVDNVRVAKILGGSVAQSTIVNGFVLTRDAEGTIKHARNTKVAVFSCGIDMSDTETKGTVLVKSAQELMDYNKSEENKMEEIIKGIAATGAKVVISGSKIGEMAMHFIERYKLMAIKVPSKFDLRRVCKAVGATALVRMGAPTPEELGECDEVSIEEIGSTKCAVFRQKRGDESGVSTIVVRGSTVNIMDDIERAIDDGVNAYKALAKDGRQVAGAGAVEVEIARQLISYGESVPGLEQYAIKKFAEALEVIPRTLAENAGMTATDLLSTLYAAHEKGQRGVGVDVENQTLLDANAHGILDALAAKYWALKYATDAAMTVLRVDQIIMSKPAGGPKRSEQPADGGDED